MTEPAWPDLPPEWRTDSATVKAYRALLLAAKVALAKDAAEASPKPPPSLADDGSEIKLHDNLATLVMGSIDRARDGAKFVETAAAALGTVYTGILAFSFAATGTHLPARGLYAALFLGIAIVGASFYLAFIQQIRKIGRVDYRGSRPEDQWRRTEYLGAWIGAVVKTRAWALRAAVFALAFGVVFMPAAFLPDHIAGNAFVTPQLSAATPTATPEPTWPAPPTGTSDSRLAAELYRAQLDQFVQAPAGATAGGSSEGVSADSLAFVVFLIGLGLVAIVAALSPLTEATRRIRQRIRAIGRRPTV